MGLTLTPGPLGLTGPVFDHQLNPSSSAQSFFVCLTGRIELLRYLPFPATSFWSPLITIVHRSPRSVSSNLLPALRFCARVQAHEGENWKIRFRSILHEVYRYPEAQSYFFGDRLEHLAASLVFHHPITLQYPSQVKGFSRSRRIRHHITGRQNA